MSKRNRQKVRVKNKINVPTLNKQIPGKLVLPDRLGLDIQINTQWLLNKSLFVSTPMYGGQCLGQYARCMMGLQQVCHDLEIPFNCHFLHNESLIPRGRNYCCDEFLRARIGPEPPKPLDKDGKPLLDADGKEVKPVDNRPFYTHMLFIDSDISFDPVDVILMLAMMDPGNDKDVVCATYPKKTIAWEKIYQGAKLGVGAEKPDQLERLAGDFVFNPLNADEIPLGQPVEVLESGTGFMMIQRQAFAKFDAMFPSQSYRPDHVRMKQFDGHRPIMAYFDCPIDRGYTFDDVHALMVKAANGEDVKEQFAQLLEIESKASMRYLSEDYMFCQYLRRAGGHIWLLPWVKLGHTGTYTFGGSIPDLAAVGAHLTADPTKLKNKH